MFPDIIKKIPARDYKMDGLEVHVDHTSTGTIYFVSAEKEVVFPEHSHAAEERGYVVKCIDRIIDLGGEIKNDDKKCAPVYKDAVEYLKYDLQVSKDGLKWLAEIVKLAQEQGLNDVAEKLIESANQEAVHAGFYAVLNGKYPKDFWALLETVKKAEIAGEAQVKAMADKVRAAGFAEAADEMEIFARQEGHHGVVIDEIFKKYNPPKIDAAGKKVYVCPICGYEYVGDIDSEPEDWTCPLCGQPKSAFKLKGGMTIKAVKLYENGFMTQPFAMGGEDGAEKFDANIRYRSSLQNFVIDTGKEIILVDTGMPLETPDMVVDDKTQIYIGKRIKDYVSALKAIILSALILLTALIKISLPAKKLLTAFITFKRLVTRPAIALSLLRTAI